MNSLVFQAPMVRALGIGIKTQTRRLTKGLCVRLPARVTADWPLRGALEPGVHAARLGGHGAVAVQIPGANTGEFIGLKPGEFHFIPKALGVDGVRSTTALVTEAFSRGSHWQITPPKGKQLYVREALKLRDGHAYYAADEEPCLYVDAWPWQRPHLSPIHMPEGARRYVLADITIKLERLQDISDDDARAEGIRELPLQEGEPVAWWTGDALAGPELHGRTPREAFRRLWCRIHSQQSWDENPWLFAYSFTVRHREDL